MVIKKITISTVLLISIFTCQAQFRSILKSIDEIEILGGASIISQRGLKGTEHNRLKLGYVLGIGARWDLKGSYSLTLKILSERKGILRSYDVYYYDENLNEFQGKTDEIINLDYFSLPVNIRHYFGKNERFYVELGPYLSYLFKAQSRTVLSWKGTDIYNVKKYYTDFDFGVSARFGYKVFAWNNVTSYLWVYATYGFIDVSKQDLDYQVSRNESIGIGISILKKWNNTTL